MSVGGRGEEKSGWSLYRIKFNWEEGKLKFSFSTVKIFFKKNPTALKSEDGFYKVQVDCL